MSAFIKDLNFKDLPSAVKVDVARFTSAKKAKLPHFGMTVKELLPKADPHNLATARKHVKRVSVKKCMEDVQGRLGSKYILVNNDRIVDGHHFLAKAERGGVTNSLDVLDLTSARFQLAARLKLTNFSDNSRPRSRLSEAATIAAGTGVGYAGLRIGLLAKAAQGAARETEASAKNVNAVTGGVLKVGRNLKMKLSKVPLVRRLFSEQLTGRLAKDRYIKKMHDEDLDRRDANLGRSAVAGAVAGALLPGKKLRLAKRALLGAAAGGAGVLAVRQATNSTRDVYGDRSRGAKQAEKLPVAAAVGVGGYAVLRKRLKLLSSKGATIEFREEERKPLPAAVKAGISAGLSGAALGLIPGLKRGTSLRKVLKSVATGAATGAGVVGGGTVIGSKILGEPEKGEGAPITKRAAIGSAIAAAPIGIVGGVLLHKTAAGRKLLNNVARKTKNPHWLSRPAAIAKKLGPVGTAAIAGTAATVAAGAHAADEGQQVDTLNSLREDRKKTGKLFARIQATIEFGRSDQPRYAATKRYADPLRAYGDAASLVDAAGNSTTLTQSQLLGSAWRTGRQVRKVAQRGSNLTRDVYDSAVKGKRSRSGKPEWEKQWVHNAVLTSGGAGAVLAHAVLRRKLPRYRMKTDALEQTAKAGVAKGKAKLDKLLGLAAKGRMILFDYRDRGDWDLRDARGKSARVFAPGSTARVRRKADWHETKDGQRKILVGAGVAASAASLGLGLALGPELLLRRKMKLRAKLNAARPPAAGKVVQFPTSQAG